MDSKTKAKKKFFKGNAFLYIGFVITAAMLAMIIVSFFWTPFNPTEMDTAAKMAGPNSVHLLGTDNLGRDILSRIMKGAGTTFLISVCFQ